MERWERLKKGGSGGRLRFFGRSLISVGLGSLGMGMGVVEAGRSGVWSFLALAAHQGRRRSVVQRVLGMRAVRLVLVQLGLPVLAQTLFVLSL